ncbi:MAG: aldolase [Phycisphaeraceae bacterium]|nr:aldolase [Phycisphaeraceae bacterium]
MFESKIRAHLSRGEPALAFCCHLTDPAVHELVGLMGFDAIWFDMEHHVYTLEKAQDLIRAARIGAGADALVRPAAGEYKRMMRMLEAGAQAVLYPRCSGAAEAREVVRSMKFPPLGERGLDGGNRDMPFCHMDTNAYIKAANEQTVLFCQIETPEGLDAAEAMLDVEGVDGLFFGPTDYSMEAGIPGQMDHPMIDDAVRKIADAARRAGKHWGAPCNAERAKKLLDLGATMLCTGADIIMVKMGMQRTQEEFGSLGFKFDNVLERRKKQLEEQYG